jgi:hypothetical protein
MATEFVCLFVVSKHRQAHAIYFDLSNAFDLVPHSLLLDKLSAFGLSGGYVNWSHSPYPTGNLGFMFVVFFPRLLNFSRCSSGICLGTPSLQCIH